MMLTQLVQGLFKANALLVLNLSLATDCFTSANKRKIHSVELLATLRLCVKEAGAVCGEIKLLLWGQGLSEISQII